MECRHWLTTSQAPFGRHCRHVISSCLEYYDSWKAQLTQSWHELPELAHYCIWVVDCSGTDKSVEGRLPDLEIAWMGRLAVYTSVMDH